MNLYKSTKIKQNVLKIHRKLTKSVHKSEKIQYKVHWIEINQINFIELLLGLFEIN